MFRLDHVVMDYPWGSTDQIPRLLGAAPAGGPVAEIWLGAHPLASATVARGEDDAGVSLREVIARNPADACGPGAPPELPFLLKVLGVGQPLSLQVHPSAERARAGFEREEALGVPLEAPERTYKDPWAKAEMVYALDSFDLLAGFRAPDEIRRALEPLARSSRVAAAMGRALAAPGPEGLRGALAAALDTGGDPAEGAEEFAAACRRQLAAPGEDPGPYAAPAALARRFPGDRALPVVLMMNHLSLAPGEALFVPPGTLHTYQRGLGIELLSPSDNVIRAGLTSKHVDPAALLEAVDTTGRGPSRPAVTRHDGVRLLRPPTPEFQLADIRVNGSVTAPLAGPRVALALEGDATAFTDLGSLHLGRGESLFAMDAEGALTLRGKGRVIVAAPGEGAGGRPGTVRIVE
ncbi:MAG: mannose-6-phosphate isomerase, class I, partial [Bifidobacteriaceae bacterium]|nr:mannose-6-phosphate isomerase, class I [Bifidobacteriaceae bacterium]